MKKIVITGFDPFGGESQNPALEVVKQLPKQIQGVQIITLIVPTVFHRCAEMIADVIEKEQPDAILSVGQAGGRTAVTLERVAINVDDARIPDNAGQQPIDQVIQAEGAPAYFATLPIKAMVQAIHDKGIPAQVSNSAGTFVCNHLMYQVLHLTHQSTRAIQAGFMHIPYLPSQAVRYPSQPSMAQEQVLQALTIAIETMIERVDTGDIRITGGLEH